MRTSSFSSLFPKGKAIIGMVHVKPLPGTPGYDRQRGMAGLIEDALDDANRLIEAGVDGIQIENQWDRPFLRQEDLGPETAAVLTEVTCKISELSDIPLGMNVHLNGCIHAMAIAKASGCRWIRAFQLANGYISNSGYVDGIGPELMRYRTSIDADDVMVFGDFQVKHGSHAVTADRTLLEKAHDIQESLGDAAIITGAATGNPPDAQSCKAVQDILDIPLLIGSGLSIRNIEELWPQVDGAIIGSSFKEEGRIENRISVERVTDFIRQARRIEE